MNGVRPWYLCAVLILGCKDPVDMMMSAMCGAAPDGDPVAVGDDQGGDCTPRKVAGDPCHHRGGYWPHDWAADYFGNQLYPDSGAHAQGTPGDYGFGCDAELRGVSFDGWIKNGAATPIVFEMKTADWTGYLSLGCPDAIKQSILDKTWSHVIASVNKEEPVAAKCGYRYQLVFTDRQLYQKAIDYFQPPHTVDPELCDGCGSAPAQPPDYPADFPITGSELPIDGFVDPGVDSGTGR